MSTERTLVVVGVLLLLLTGCAQQPTKQVVDLGTRPAGQEFVDQDPDEAAGEIPVEPVEGALVRGLDPTSAPEPRAVAAVWFAFREEVNRMYREVTVDRTRLSELAADEAYDVPVAETERLQAQGSYDVGGTIASITDVRVHGDYAHVEGCLRTDMVETAADGTALEPPEVFVVTQDTLEKRDGRWQVTAVQAVRSPGCEYR